MQKTNELARQSVVLLIDDLRLRRAAVASLLTPWADGFGASIELGQISGVEDPADPPRDRAMILVNIGNTSVFRAGLDISLRQLVERAVKVPVVVISDLDDPVEMAKAFEAGVRGFVPTSIAPELALKALTFILNGGHFFPPSVLQPAMRRARLILSAQSSNSPEKPNGGSARVELRIRYAASTYPRLILRVLVRFRTPEPCRSEPEDVKREWQPGRHPQLSRKPLRKAARKGSTI
ncbi:response regulator transcription factor [Rhizobium sp. P32RR-XVIII]|uniref:response regulator transcription factor n=1 Tax=Rhizobium sp. P32RR-XVIII TaxID=2726738 RepID=UPI0014566B14|nr:response regulator transcription factor [Rhizobium sp. P32RR-XVIII]NLS05293.1 response regulator transcription factor [Rhizobium sp. P32RR-XVIII]